MAAVDVDGLAPGVEPPSLRPLAAALALDLAAAAAFFALRFERGIELSYDPTYATVDVLGATILRCIVLAYVARAASRKAERAWRAKSSASTFVRPLNTANTLAIVFTFSLVLIKLLLRLVQSKNAPPEKAPPAWDEIALCGVSLVLSVVEFLTMRSFLLKTEANCVAQRRNDRLSRLNFVDDEEAEDSSDDEEQELLSFYRTKSDARNVGTRFRELERRRKRRQRRRKKKKSAAAGSAPGRTIKQSAVKQLFSFAAPDWMLLSVAFVFLVLAALCSSSLPYFTGKVVNSLTDSDRAGLHRAIFSLTIAAVLNGLFSGVRGAIFTVGMGRANVRVRKKLLERLLSQELGFFDSNTVGELSSRLSADCTRIADQISLNLNVLLRTLVEASIVLTLMFSLSWKLALLSFVSLPVMVFITKVYSEFYRKMSRDTQEALADANANAEEALRNVSTLRDFDATSQTLKEYDMELERFYALNSTQARWYAGYALSWATLPFLVTAMTLWYGAETVLDRDPGAPCHGGADSLCAGDLVSFLFYQQSLTASLQTLSTIYSGIASALGAADKVFELINRRSKAHWLEDESAAELIYNHEDEESFVPSIVFEHVDMTYPSRPEAKVLNDFSLQISPGEVVALVGYSGAGKSTIAKLLQSHYVPDSGRVLVSGKSVTEWRQSFLKRKISVVGQEPVLYNRSVYRNVIYGLEGTPNEPSFSQVVRACERANALEFIRELPRNFAEELGDRGSTLSGGQKQRLAIARALCRPGLSILILDEATSNLDTASERMVQSALANVVEERDITVVVVAHRLSTVKDFADNIVVLDKGRIVEQGPHDELMSTKGLYFDLVSKQQVT